MNIFYRSALGTFLIILTWIVFYVCSKKNTWINFRTDFDLDSCIEFSDNDLEGALRALEGQEELNPQEVAIIKYTPSVDNPNADFADEVYYPPIDTARQQQELRRKILGPGKAIERTLDLA